MVGVPVKVRIILGTVNGELGSVVDVSVDPSGLKNRTRPVAVEGQLPRYVKNRPLDDVVVYAAFVSLNIPVISVQAVGVHWYRVAALNALAPANIKFIFVTLVTFQPEIF
jgi:hypothetical protein